MRSNDTAGDETSLAELAAAITAGAVRLAAATAAWLRLVAEFDRRGGWHGFGIQSCAHWLAWQCGLGPGAAREHVRVARALTGLPRIEAAFAAGRLSYSKVRALTRVAAPDCEASLVDFALYATASQTERFCRQWRRADAAADSGAGHGDPARRIEDEQAFDHWYDDDGYLTLRIRLPGPEGAALLTRIEARAERDARRERAQATKAAAAHEAMRAAGGTVDRDLEERCAEDAAVGRVRERRTARRVTALTQLVEAGAGQEHRRPGDPPRREFVVHVDAAVLADDAAAGRAHVEGGPAITGAQARRMLCEASVVAMLERGSEPLALGRRKRRATRAQWRALLRRDTGCARPGCPETRIERLHAHHMRHWLFGGRTDIDNLVLLCDVDHGLVHEHDLGMSRRDGRLVVSTPDGQQVWGSADAAFATGIDGSPPDPGSGDDAYAGVHPIDTTVGRRPAASHPDGAAPPTSESWAPGSAAASAPAQAGGRRPERPARRTALARAHGARGPRRGGRLAAVRPGTRAAGARPDGPHGVRRRRADAAHRPTTAHPPTAAPLSASAESDRLDRILFPDGAPPRPESREAHYDRMDMAWAISVLMGNRDVVRRREAERGRGG